MKKIGRLLLLFFVLSFLFRTDTSFDQDLGRHIKLGEIIWQTKEIPKTNLFSYTNPNFPFINTHWLFEVLAYGFNQTIGLYWMLVLKIVVIILSVWLTIKTIPRQNWALLLPIGFIFLHVLRERLELRPEIFSFLFTALTLFILERFCQMSHDRRKFDNIFLLPFIQLFWINTHIYFFVGFMLQGIFLINLTYQRIRSHIGSGKLKFLSIIFILSVFVSFINPNGLQGVLYPLNVTENYGYTIVENQTMFLLESIEFRDPNFLFVKLSVGLVALSLLVTSLRKQFEVKNILLALSGVVLALMNVRSFPYLVFLSLPAVLQNFGPIKNNRFFSFLLLVTFALLLLESFFYLNGDYYRYRDGQHEVGLKYVESVKGGMDFILANDLPGPIYNNFDIGSYIIYRGYLPAGRQGPKYQVFIDGRPEAYPAQFFQDIYIPTQSDYIKFKELEDKYGFKTIIFSHTDQTPWGKSFLQNVVKDESWKTVYVDDFVIVFTKEGNPIDLSKLSPDSYKFTNHRSYLNLGLFLLSEGFTDSGKQFILKAREVFPNSPAINQIMGNQVSNKFFW